MRKSYIAGSDNRGNFVKRSAGDLQDLGGTLSKQLASKETGTQVYIQREVNSAKNLNGFGSRFFHNVSRKECMRATPDVSLFKPKW